MMTYVWLGLITVVFIITILLMPKIFGVNPQSPEEP